MLQAVLRSLRRTLGMGRLLRMAVSIVEQRMCEARPSIDHQCVNSSLSTAEEFGWITGGSDERRSRSYRALGSRSSEMWPNMSWLTMRLVMAMFQEPQSFFPVNLGMSLVDGRVGGRLGGA